MKFGGVIIWASCLAVIIDRFLKTLIEQPLFSGNHLGWRFFAFERFHNAGIAFNIPVSPGAAIPITIIFLGALWFWIRGPARIWLVPIFLGAISNLLDRILFQVTLDYLRILYSVINIADLLVLVGMLGLIFSKKDS